MFSKKLREKKCLAVSDIIERLIKVTTGFGKVERAKVFEEWFQRNIREKNIIRQG